MSLYIKYPASSAGSGGGGVTVYVNLAAFPVSASNGTLAVAGDTHILYEYNSTAVAWQPIASNTAYLDALASAGSANSIGALDSQAANAQGLALVSNVLSAQSADATHPGLVNNTTQSFSGNKTFTGAISASNLSGTNTGDVTLGTASGLSLAGQALSLGLSSISTTGALSSTDWITFSGKQASGSYITALTGDITASGPGSAVATLATVNSNVGSFTNANITVNAKGLITAASTTAAGNLTDVGTDGIVITGGTGAVIGTGTSIAQTKADATHNGYLSSTDWSTFNGKGAGTVTTVSVASTNGFAGTSSGGATPALTLSTSITGVLKGNGTAISAATAGTDYSAGTSALGTGILKSTTTTGALTIAVAGDFPTLNQNTSGTAANVTGVVALINGGTGTAAASANAAFNALSPMTTGGDLIYGGASGAATRLANGSAGQYLASAGGTSAPTYKSFKAPTLQIFLAGGTYTPPSPAPLYIKVRMVGGGGGGGGTGPSNTPGGDGGNTTWGSTILVANGGVHGTGSTGNGGVGGTAVVTTSGTVLQICALTGGRGQGSSTANDTAGGGGGVSPFGGAGAGDAHATGGDNAQQNTGSGGGGGGGNTTIAGGGGGGAGGYLEAILTGASIASTVVSPGGGGTGGGAGTGGVTGEQGGSGAIFVEEYYQ